MEAQAKLDHLAAATTLEQIQHLEAQYLLTTYARQPILLVRGKGSTLYDERGRAYKDFISGIGVNVLGYDHPRIRRVLREHASLMHTSNLFYHSYQGPLAERLAQASGLARVFFCNTGAESIEGALKLARAWQRRQGRENKTEFVSLVNSFHGRTMGALSVTAQEKYRAPFEPLIPGVRFINANNHEEARVAINERTAAVIIEPIQGESGIRPLSSDYLQTLREACDATQTLLIVDEVQSGLGRTGKTFAFQNTEIQPDILCIAKPLGLGVPLGAFLASAQVGDAFKPGDHGSTFGGGPLACHLSLEFMQMLAEGALMRRVAEVGAYFKTQLLKLRQRHPQVISEVRGLGLMIGAELSFPCKEVVTQMLARGYLLNCAHETTLRFLPPYIIKKSEIKAMLTELEEVLLEQAKAREEASEGNS